MMCKTRNLVRCGALLLFCSTLLWGCGSKITRENYEKIRSGMTQAEVTAILGNPTESSSIGLGPLGGTTSTWKASGGTITIQFVNDKVFAKAFSDRTS